MKILDDETLNLLLEIEWTEEQRCFYSYYQDGSKSFEEFRTFNQLSLAYQNTKSRITQFNLNHNLVAKLIKDIFKDDKRLKRDILIHVIDGKDYLIGGRHRLFAIKNVFDTIIKELKLDEYFLYEQSIRVDIFLKNDYSTFEDDIIADNDSRTMPKAERIGVKSQKYGADPNRPISFVETALDNFSSASALKEHAAQYFVWQFKDSGIPQQARQDIGKRLAQYIFFGHQTITKATKLEITDANEFAQKADALWTEVLAVTAGEKVVARQAVVKAKEAISRFEAK